MLHRRRQARQHKDSRPVAYNVFSVYADDDYEEGAVKRHDDEKDEEEEEVREEGGNDVLRRLPSSQPPPADDATRAVIAPASTEAMTSSPPHRASAAAPAAPLRGAVQFIPREKRRRTATTTTTVTTTVTSPSPGDVASTAQTAADARRQRAHALEQYDQPTLVEQARERERRRRTVPLEQRLAEAEAGVLAQFQRARRVHTAPSSSSFAAADHVAAQSTDGDGRVRLAQWSDWRLPAHHLVADAAAAADAHERAQRVRHAHEIQVESLTSTDGDRRHRGERGGSSPSPPPPPPMTSFADMQLPGALVEELRRRGITAPTNIQMQALPAALAGHDVIGMAGTGSGKTLAYLLPMMMTMRRGRRGRNATERRFVGGLVLAPSRELARQIYEVACAYGGVLGVRVGLYVGGGGGGSSDSERVDIAVATPGRCLDLLRRRHRRRRLHLEQQQRRGRPCAEQRGEGDMDVGSFSLRFVGSGSDDDDDDGDDDDDARGGETCAARERSASRDETRAPLPPPPRIIVLDEADRLLEDDDGGGGGGGGGAFDSDVRAILSMCGVASAGSIVSSPSSHTAPPPPPPQLLAFSATLPRKVQAFAAAVMHYHPILVRTSRAGISRNVDQHFLVVPPPPSPSRFVRLLDALAATPPPVLIFADSRDQVDQIHEYLLLKGVLTVVSVHGGRTQQERDAAVARMRAAKAADVLVCTDVAAKGLDFAGVRHVILFSVPRSVDAYIHRIGRTGRYYARARGGGARFADDNDNDDDGDEGDDGGGGGHGGGDEDARRSSQARRRGRATTLLDQRDADLARAAVRAAYGGSASRMIPPGGAFWVDMAELLRESHYGERAAENDDEGEREAEGEDDWRPMPSFLRLADDRTQRRCGGSGGGTATAAEDEQTELWRASRDIALAAKEIGGVRGCGYCGGLGHRVLACDKLMRAQQQQQRQQQ